jgi:CRISPR system Cascade subunit CasB
MMELVGPRGTSDEALSAAKLKQIRFRALLAMREDDELLTAMRRLVTLAGNQANIRDLARAVLDWSDGTRRRWAFDYYGAAPRAEPPASSAATESMP